MKHPSARAQPHGRIFLHRAPSPLNVPPASATSRTTAHVLCCHLPNFHHCHRHGSVTAAPKPFSLSLVTQPSSETFLSLSLKILNHYRRAHLALHFAAAITRDTWVILAAVSEISIPHFLTASIFSAQGAELTVFHWNVKVLVLLCVISVGYEVAILALQT